MNAVQRLDGSWGIFNILLRYSLILYKSKGSAYQKTFLIKMALGFPVL